MNKERHLVKHAAQKRAERNIMTTIEEKIKNNINDMNELILGMAHNTAPQNVEKFMKIFDNNDNVAKQEGYDGFYSLMTIATSYSINRNNDRDVIIMNPVMVIYLNTIYIGIEVHWIFDINKVDYLSVGIVSIDSLR